MVFREGASSAGMVIAAVGPHLVGADATDGTVLWKRTIGAVKDRSVLLIALQHENVIAGRGNDLVCINQRSGEIVWKTESPVAMLTLLVDGERIFASYVGEVACFDAKGALVWHEALHGGEGRMSLAAGGVVVQGVEPPDWRLR